MVKIFLVDDHALYRDGIRAALSKLTCFQTKIIGEAGSATEFFLSISAGKVPDLLLLDIMLPDLSGVEIARRMKKDYPDVKIIMLSSEVSEELITELIDIGVEGYLNKLARKEDIHAALCAVVGGSQYFGSNVAKMMYNIYLNQQFAKNTTQNKASLTAENQDENNTSDSITFTERELEIMRQLCDGKLIKEIAEELNISTRTVETHKNNILKKLGFSNLIDLVKYAIKEGITTL